MPVLRDLPDDDVTRHGSPTVCPVVKRWPTVFNKVGLMERHLLLQLSSSSPSSLSLSLVRTHTGRQTDGFIRGMQKH